MDSIINYETVKYFTGEEFEINRFKSTMIKFFRVYSYIQLSRGLLDIMQQVLLQKLYGRLHYVCIEIPEICV